MIGLLPVSTNTIQTFNPDPPMTFETFQNRARLYVIGALYPAEIAEFQQATTQFGTKAKTFIQDCYALRDAFALSLRAPESRAALKDRVVWMARARERHQ